MEISLTGEEKKTIRILTGKNKGIIRLYAFLISLVNLRLQKLSVAETILHKEKIHFFNGIFIINGFFRVPNLRPSLSSELLSNRKELFLKVLIQYFLGRHNRFIVLYIF